MDKWLRSVSLVAVAVSALAGCTVDTNGGAVAPQPDDPIEPAQPRDGGVGKPSPRGTVIDSGFDVTDGFPGSQKVPPRLSNVVVANRPPPSISGGTLTVTKAGDLAIAADSDRDALYLISLPDLTVRTVRFPQGSEPGRVLLDGAGGVHVALRSAGAVVRVDLATATAAVQTSACQLPRGLAYDASKDEVVVACASGELVALDATTHAEHTRVQLDLDLRDVVIGLDGQRFVSRYRSAQLLKLGADSKVASSGTPRVSTSQRIEIPSISDDGGLSPASSMPGFERDVQLSAALAWRTIAAPDGSSIMLHQQSQDDEVVISQAGGYGGGCQPITQAGITRYDASGQPITEPALLGGGALIVDLAVSPDGAWYALAKPGAYLRGERGSLELISATVQTQSSLGGAIPIAQPTFDEADGGLIGVDPSFPAGPCNTGIEDQTNTQTTAVAFDGQGVLYAFSREPAQLTIYEAQRSTSPFNGVLNVTQTLALSTDSVSDTGHDLFHGDVGSGLACASCHGEALDDGHIWNFRDFGSRRTQNIRGGLLSTLPLHWEGDLTSFQSLVDEVMTRRMGGFVVDAALATTLANWIDKQPALSLKSSDASATLRGKTLFESADLSCSTCHAGAALTDNQTLDVGTGGMFQVPSLRGLGLRAPYMHDGCAVTLADRFDPACGGGDKHGKTSQLSAADEADLIAYLQTL